MREKRTRWKRRREHCSGCPRNVKRALDLRIVPKPAHPKEPDLQRQAVQRLASSVRDETHWAQILESAETEDQRTELERVVGPLLPFRRAAPCTTPECPSGQQGVWQPMLVVVSPLDSTNLSWVPIELRLCDTCKAEATMRDFLTDGIWDQVLAQWEATIPPPVRRLTTLSWNRIH
jgi:hypothetical protein